MDSQLLELNATYEVVTPPSVDAEVLTLTDLKAQCRIDVVDEAELVKGHLAAAIDKLESDTGLILRPTTFALMLDRFPCATRAIELARAPVTSIESITYFDADGEEQTLESDNYLAAFGRPSRIVPAFGTHWPPSQRRPQAVRIEFVCGFAEGEVPPRALQAIRMMVGHWFLNREAVADRRIEEIAEAYSSLKNALDWRA